MPVGEGGVRGGDVAENSEKARVQAVSLVLKDYEII